MTLKPEKKFFTEVNADGCLVLPKELAQSFGLTPGVKVVLEEGAHDVRLRRPVSHLAKVYVELTNACNLDCRTCMRQVWDEPIGKMSATTFARLLAGLKSFAPLPDVFFGGLGEPLLHAQVVEAVRQVKQLGARAELITNGILLSEELAGQLIEAGLDVLWVSIDGATPESYADIRLGAELPQVLKNIARLKALRDQLYQFAPRIGIAFVAMQRNIADLPEVLRLGVRLGADQFSISNVLAHVPELRDEVLYAHTQYAATTNLPDVNWPRMDLTPQTLAAYGEALCGDYRLNLAGGEVAASINTCPFIQKGSTAIRWDGTVSPCLPLLHTHASYLDDHLRQSHAYTVGNILEQDLADLWNAPVYMALRQQLCNFDFSFCTVCNSCEMADDNREDCFGNVAPACGGCLWAQGFILCP